MPTGFSPSLTSPSRELGHGPPQRTRLETTIRQPEAGDFQVGLFPVHSPLLGESWLVSFPPLIDMLKFSGWSCLISGRRVEAPGACDCGPGDCSCLVAERTIGCDLVRAEMKGDSGMQR